MNGDRAARIWNAVALRAMREKRPPAPTHACAECAEALTVDGAGLMLAAGPGTLEPVCCAGDHAAQADAVQVTLGEGPGIEASATGYPVLVDDLTSSTFLRRWPTFAHHVEPLGVRAVHSFPLALGAVHVGALSLYSHGPRDFCRDDLVDALIYADTALLLVLGERAGIDTTDGAMIDGQTPALWRAEVHQAATMVSMQSGISVLDALAQLRAHAYHHDLSLESVARSVVEHDLHFDPGGTGCPPAKQGLSSSLRKSSDPGTKSPHRRS